MFILLILDKEILIVIKGPYGEDIRIDGANKSKGDDVLAYLKKQKVDDIEFMILHILMPTISVD